MNYAPLDHSARREARRVVTQPPDVDNDYPRAGCQAMEPIPLSLRETFAISGRLPNLSQSLNAWLRTRGLLKNLPFNFYQK